MVHKKCSISEMEIIVKELYQFLIIGRKNCVVDNGKILTILDTVKVKLVDLFQNERKKNSLTCFFNCDTHCRRILVII